MQMLKAINIDIIYIQTFCYYFITEITSGKEFYFLD